TVTRLTEPVPIPSGGESGPVCFCGVLPAVLRCSRLTCGPNQLYRLFRNVLSRSVDEAAGMEPTDQMALLQFARGTIRAHLEGGRPPEPPSVEDPKAGFGGAFVTLHKAGRLRGCIGRFNPSSGLAATVADMAVALL